MRRDLFFLSFLQMLRLQITVSQSSQVTIVYINCKFKCYPLYNIISPKVLSGIQVFGAMHMLTGLQEQKWEALFLFFFNLVLKPVLPGYWRFSFHFVFILHSHSLLYS